MKNIKACISDFSANAKGFKKIIEACRYKILKHMDAKVYQVNEKENHNKNENGKDLFERKKWNHLKPIGEKQTERAKKCKTPEN